MTGITEQERNRLIEQQAVVEMVAGALAYEPRFLNAVLEHEEAFIADPTCDLGVQAFNALVEIARDKRDQPSLSEAANDYLRKVCAAFTTEEERAFADAFRCAVQRHIVASEPESGGRIFSDIINWGYFVAHATYPAGTPENFVEVARLMAIGPEVTPDSLCIYILDKIADDPEARAAYDADPVQFVVQYVDGWLKEPAKDAIGKQSVKNLAQEVVQIITAELAQAA
ncbi:MAG: hypothetical protein IKZ87_00175 [Actinomycetaceae bacterium]|nr:hypothetical protein [Actinomycetaceae bacterium]